MAEPDAFHYRFADPS
jgi:hypothetical protein